MSEFEQRKKSFEKLGNLVAHRHHENEVAYRRDGQPLVDGRALRLGRYLWAARKNADLSPQALADRAGISLATILALEQGLILSRDIKPTWLQKIAAALDEDVNSFRLLLGQPLLSSRRKRLPVFGRSWPRSQIRPVFATLSAALLCLMVSAIVWLHPPRTLYPSSTLVPATPEMTKKSTLIDIGPGERLNLTNAERMLEAQSALRSANSIQAEPALAPDIGAPGLLWKSRMPEMSTLVDISAEERLNMVKAEFRFGDQVRILRTLIDINAEDRQNMVKAEIKL